MILVFVLIHLASTAAQSNSLSFGTISRFDCNYQPINFTLIAPAWDWSTTQAEAFVIAFKELNLLRWGSFDATATVNNNQSWSILSDSRNEDYGELWIPIQPEGTIVSITFFCLTNQVVNYTVEPVVPQSISGASTGILDLYYQNVVDTENDIHAHWWALRTNILYESFGVCWMELCAEPSSYVTKTIMRVVIPGVNVTNPAGNWPNSNTVLLTGYSNLRIETFAKAAFMWDYLFNVPLIYVSVYTEMLNELVPINFNIYQATSQTPSPYTIDLQGGIGASGMQVHNDLLLSYTTGDIPLHYADMALYAIDTSQYNSDLYLFTSVCFLKSNGKQYKFAGKLQNATDFSSSMLKAPNFFLKNRTTKTTFALTYGDYAVLANFNNVPVVPVSKFYKDSKIYFWAMIGLIGFAAILIWTVIYLYTRVKKQGYARIN